MDRGSYVRDEDIDASWPDLPDWAELDDLAPDVRRDLRGLSKPGAEFVGRHLVAAGTLADDDPETAWLHARAARSKGGRIAVVRETVGLVAYRAGEWAEAMAELRAARRMGGGPGHLAVMADCERALGHPERAIELSRSAEADELDDDARLELTIVVAGARADMDQLDAALVSLEGAGLAADKADPRLLYAYADLLAGAGRTEEALEWFIRAHDADVEEDTDAADRIAELAGAGDRADENTTGSEQQNGGSDRTSTVDQDVAGTGDVADIPAEPPGDQDVAGTGDAANVPAEPQGDQDVAGTGDVADVPAELRGDQAVADARNLASHLAEQGIDQDAGGAAEPGRPTDVAVRESLDHDPAGSDGPAADPDAR